jgi:hypothetical protein
MARFANHMHLTHHKEFFEDVAGQQPSVEGVVDVAEVLGEEAAAGMQW